MLELGISQAQSQFTKLLSQTTVIVDRKSHSKKAVILPYLDYLALVSKATKKDDLQKGAFSEFIGILDDDFTTDDKKYIDITK